MLNTNNLTKLATAALLVAGSPMDLSAQPAAISKPSNSLVSTKATAILRQFPNGLNAAVELGKAQEKSFASSGKYFADESEADAAVLKVMSAFYLDVTKQKYLEGTDDPRAPQEEIQAKLHQQGLHLDFSTVSKNGETYTSINLYRLGAEIKLPNSDLVNPTDKYSVSYREIAELVFGDPSASKLLGMLARDSAGTNFTILINSKQCSALDSDKSGATQKATIARQLELVKEQSAYAEQ